MLWPSDFLACKIEEYNRKKQRLKRKTSHKSAIHRKKSQSSSTLEVVEDMFSMNMVEEIQKSNQNNIMIFYLIFYLIFYQGDFRLTWSFTWSASCPGFAAHGDLHGL